MSMDLLTLEEIAHEGKISIFTVRAWRHQRRGVIVVLEGDTLCLKPRRALDNTLLARVRDEKLAILEAIRNRPQNFSEAFPAFDAYAERMREALRQINATDYPAGMVLWLDKVHPDLYAELTSRIPDEIDRLWNERSPLEQFEAVLARMVTLHRQCCEMRRAAESEELYWRDMSDWAHNRGKYDGKR